MIKSMPIAWLMVAALVCSTLPESADAQETKGAIRNKTIAGFRMYEPAKSALGKLETLGGVKIVANWEVLKKAGADPDEKVLLRGGTEKLTDVIDSLLSQIANGEDPLGWYIKGGAIYLVSTQTATYKTATAPRMRAAPSKNRSAPATARQRRGTRRSSPRGVGYHFVETPLVNVIELYRSSTGLNFYVNWKALEQSAITRDTPVSFNLHNISTAQALDYTMKSINGDRGVYESVYWVVDGGVVRISTGTKLDKTVKTMVYDITDMLAVISNSKGPRIKTDAIGQGSGGSGGGGSAAGTGFLGGAGGLGGGLGGGGGGLFEDAESSEDSKSHAEQVEEKKQEILKMIKTSIGDEFWAPQGKGSVMIVNNQLIIKQSLLGLKLMSGGA